MADDKPDASVDPIQTAIMINRLESIVREMTNALLRSARSAVISSARDFSCGIVTADNRILASAEGLPVHIFGMNVQTAKIAEHHPDLSDGDAAGSCQERELPGMPPAVPA